MTEFPPFILGYSLRKDGIPNCIVFSLQIARKDFSQGFMNSDPPSLCGSDLQAPRFRIRDFSDRALNFQARTYNIGTNGSDALDLGIIRE